MAKKHMYFPMEEYEARWKKLHDHMRAKGYEIALVWGKTAGTFERSMETAYLTNFFSTHSGQEPDSLLWNARSFCCAIMEVGKPPELHTDEADPQMDRLPIDKYHAHLDPIQGVADALKKRKPKGQGRLRRQRHPAGQVRRAVQEGDAGHRVCLRGRSRSRHPPDQEPARARHVPRGRRDGDRRAHQAHRGDDHGQVGTRSGCGRRRRRCCGAAATGIGSRSRTAPRSPIPESDPLYGFSRRRRRSRAISVTPSSTGRSGRGTGSIPAAPSPAARSRARRRGSWSRIASA